MRIVDFLVMILGMCAMPVLAVPSPVVLGENSGLHLGMESEENWVTYTYVASSVPNNEHALQPNGLPRTPTHDMHPHGFEAFPVANEATGGIYRREKSQGPDCPRPNIICAADEFTCHGTVVAAKVQVTWEDKLGDWLCQVDCKISA